jgi:long-chain acyl-CoA synthetase
MNLAHLVERNARLFPERTAVSIGEAPFASQAMLGGRVRTIASHFTDRFRLPKGARIAIAMKNAPEFWEVLFAAWHAGLVAVPVNPKLHPREIEFILEHSGASLCFVSPDLTEVCGGSAEIISIGTKDYARLREPCGTGRSVADTQPADTAWLFYTSGTTGRPKGAMLSHRNLMAMILAYFADIDAIEPSDCIVHGASHSHGSGLWGLVHFAKAANNIVPESGGFDPAEIASLVNRFPGVSMFAAPTMVNRLVASPEFVASNRAHLKTIVYGGAPMYAADLARALETLGPRFAQIYGQGESPMTITGLPKPFHIDDGHPSFASRLSSVGFSRTGVEVAVVDTGGCPMPAGEPGEVAVRGDVVMSGYWQDEGAAAKALKDGWLFTGDIGRLDADGFLTLLDRSKDLIISGGMNIYPREVEEALLRHPAVAEVSVVGRPSVEWGEEVVAFAAVRPGALLTAADLDLLCLETIARFKRPKEYIFVEALPKSGNGKILKTKLREMMATAKEDA